MNPSPPSVTPGVVASMPRAAVIDYRPAGSAGDPSGEARRHVQQALVFFGLLGFGVGYFGSVPDGQRVLGALILLGCAMGYVVLRAINATTCTVSRIALSLSSAGAVFGAAIAVMFRFPHRPLEDPHMLMVGLVILVIGIALFAATRSAMKRATSQSFEK